MKKILVSLLLFSLQSFAEKSHCIDSDTGIDPKARGRVTYQVIPEICTQSKKAETTCTSTSASDVDYCKNSKILMEQFCDKNGMPSEKEIQCPCEQGHCSK